MRAAIIAAGVVVNVIEIVALTDWPGAVAAGAAGPGWLYDGTSFTPPAPHAVVPEQVTRWQAMQQMLATPSQVHPAPATLLSDVQAIVAATGGAMALAWANQQYLYRNGPFVTPALMAQVGLASADVDALFIAATALPP
jgi:hypothetical protein